MTDEHRACLTGWVQGEEILEYIEHVEMENEKLNVLLHMHEKALYRCCYAVEALAQNVNYFEAGDEINVRKTTYRTAEEWKNWCLYGSFDR